jgi:phage terminase large subunit-like protein
MIENLTQEQKLGTLKKIFSEDIELFGKYFFKHHLKLDTPKFHQEIYREYESGDLRVGIAAPRGHAKSTLTDLVYLAWCLVNQRAKFVLMVSDTYSQATLFLEAIKAEFEDNEQLRGFYGNLVSNHWSEDEIICNGVMIKCLGAGMKVRGLKFRESRPDLIIVDDLENDDLVGSKDRREKLERWFNGALIPSLSKEGRLIMIGTILHYDSLMAKVVDPVKYTEFHKKTYRAITDGKALWPEHLDLGELEKIKKNYIEQGQGYLFYQEYQNDPVSDEHRKFKIEKFRYYEEKDLQDKRLKCFITIDRAYSAEKTADFTGIVINRVDNENNWHIRSERFKGTEAELIEKIFDLKSYYKPIKIGIEQNAFEYTIKPALVEEMRRRNNFFSITELKHGGVNKNMRIEGLLNRFEAGAIKFLKTDTDIIDELIRFPKGVHDDLADACAHQLELATGGAFSVAAAANKKKFLDQFDYYTQQKKTSGNGYFTGSPYLRNKYS